MGNTEIGLRATLAELYQALDAAIEAMRPVINTTGPGTIAEEYSPTAVEARVEAAAARRLLEQIVWATAVANELGRRAYMSTGADRRRDAVEPE